MVDPEQPVKIPVAFDPGVVLANGLYGSETYAARRLPVNWPRDTLATHEHTADPADRGLAPADPLSSARVGHAPAAGRARTSAARW